MITYDEDGNTYTLKKEESGQITIIEQVRRDDFYELYDSKEERLVILRYTRVFYKQEFFTVVGRVK